MVSQRRYRLKRHYKFEEDDRKYVADLETGDIVEVNAVEWEIILRYESQTLYQIVEALKQKYGNDLLDEPEEAWLPLVRDAAVNAMMGISATAPSSSRMACAVVTPSIPSIWKSIITTS